MSRIALLLGILGVFFLTGCGGSGGGGGSGDGLPQTIKLVNGVDRAYLMDGNRIELVVSAGTVNKDTLVTVSAPTGLPSDAKFVPGTDIKFSDTTLLMPVSLRIRYNPSNIPGGASQSSLRAVRLVGGAWVEEPGSTVNTSTKQVFVNVSSFGTFGVRVMP